ncbi:methyltransferase [Amylibacter kogurei]|uniref:Methyltransferase n=1 Tax=Paramylibacter kogurei TaxID=1889778 RepID=A0A2G5K531_9RHOB|nr:FkbM family methyltransferase [Amylibacter kogurei]PIB24525.1 methyltransferase [Amylibacter kogurei]
MTNPSQKIQQAQQLLREARGELGTAIKSERSRKRGELNRLAHLATSMLGESNLFFSQSGQDRLVDSLLGGKTGGVFVDIGGYDGVTGSNTLFFEMFRKWSGIVVEPSPTQLRLANAARNVPVLGFAVAGQSGQAEFLEVTSGYTQMSGFLDSYDAKLLEKVRANPKHREVLHKLDKKTLGEILGDQDITKVDFLSLDVEGGEMGILESFDFNAFDVDIWTIENNTQSSDLPNFMRSKGYNLVEFAGVDDIFRKIR